MSVWLYRHRPKWWLLPDWWRSGGWVWALRGGFGLLASLAVLNWLLVGLAFQPGNLFGALLCTFGAGALLFLSWATR